MQIKKNANACPKCGTTMVAGKCPRCSKSGKDKAGKKPPPFTKKPR